MDIAEYLGIVLFNEVQLCVHKVCELHRGSRGSTTRLMLQPGPTSTFGPAHLTFRWSGTTVRRTLPTK